MSPHVVEQGGAAPSPALLMAGIASHTTASVAVIGTRIDAGEARLNVSVIHYQPANIDQGGTAPSRASRQRRKYTLSGFR